MAKLLYLLIFTSFFIISLQDQIDEEFETKFQDIFDNKLTIAKPTSLLVLRTTQYNNEEFRNVLKNSETFILEVKPFDKRRLDKNTPCGKSLDVRKMCRNIVYDEFLSVVNYFKGFTYADKEVYRQYSTTLGYEPRLGLTDFQKGSSKAEHITYGEDVNLKKLNFNLAGFMYSGVDKSKNPKEPKLKDTKNNKNVRLYISKTYTPFYFKSSLDPKEYIKFKGSRIGLFKYDTEINDNFDKIKKKEVTKKRTSNILSSETEQTYPFDYDVIEHEPSRLVFLQYNFIQDEEVQEDKLEFHKKQMLLALSKNMLRNLGNVGKYNFSDSGYIDFSIDRFPIKNSNQDTFKFISVFTKMYSRQNFGEDKPPIVKTVYKRPEKTIKKPSLPAKSRFMQPTKSSKAFTADKNSNKIGKDKNSMPNAINNGTKASKSSQNKADNTNTKAVSPTVYKEVIDRARYIKAIRSNCTRITNDIFTWDYLGSRNSQEDLNGTSSILMAFNKDDFVNYVYVYKSDIGFGSEDILARATDAFKDNNKRGYEATFTCSYHNDNYFTDIDLNELYLVTFTVNKLATTVETVDTVDTYENFEEESKTKDFNGMKPYEQYLI